MKLFERLDVNIDKFYKQIWVVLHLRFVKEIQESISSA